MPNALTALNMCNLVRDELQTFSFAALRNGFVDDPKDDDGKPYTSTSILTHLNEALRWMQLETGYAKCREVMQIGLVSASSTNPTPWEYRTNSQGSLIVNATINGNALARTTILREDAVNNGWQSSTNQVTGTPTSYYTIGDIIGFIPAPDTNYTVYILEDTPTSDLAAPDSVPGRLPILFHQVPVYRAALDLNDMVDLENPLSRARIARLQKKLDTGMEKLMEYVNGRGDDSDQQIIVQDYRNFFLRGVAS